MWKKDFGRFLNKMKKEKYYLLDLIRGTAALLVVMGHLRSLMFGSWDGGGIFKFIFMV